MSATVWWRFYLDGCWAWSVTKVVVIFTRNALPVLPNLLPTTITKLPNLFYHYYQATKSVPTITKLPTKDKFPLLLSTFQINLLRNYHPRIIVCHETCYIISWKLTFTKYHPGKKLLPHNYLECIFPDVLILPALFPQLFTQSQTESYLDTIHEQLSLRNNSVNWTAIKVVWLNWHA